MNVPIESVAPAIETIFLGVIANGLTSLLAHISPKGEALAIGEKIKKGDTDIQQILKESIRSITIDDGTCLPINKEKANAFLSSPEIEAIIRQIYSAKLLADTPSLELIRIEFLKLFSDYTNIPEEELQDCAKILLDVLILGCERALNIAISNGLLSAHEVKSDFRYRIVLDELESIKRSLDAPPQKKINIQEINEFEKKYRQQVAKRHGYVIPPNFDRAVKVPIDELYVDPHFIKKIDERSKEESHPIEMKNFLSRIYRVVILGIPGGGKSTFASKLCSDLAKDDSVRLIAGRQVTPILIILRDYGIGKREHNYSILQFIENLSNSKYMVPPPDGAIEYMLLNGRAIVIFDGLDELLETSYRQEISSDIESFCSYYPSVPTIVTSREVGYEQAPLDEKRFEVFSLAPFNENQVKEYAYKWFSTDSDLTYDQQKEKAISFLRESSIVPDLRSNPLTLSLMCNIYRGESYIPRNRPDVYEKCAIMLFDRWDRSRGIQLSSGVSEIEAHIRPTMAYLANRIYSNVELQGGVTEQTLVKYATDYLNLRQFDDRDEAEHAAKNFIEFCRGRAWVFTDVGTTADGERLFQFTHRTFLEYFTAIYLTRIHDSPDSLGSVLLPRIAKNEWDVVAQLAFQIQSKNSENAADRLLTALIDQIDRSEWLTGWNILSFAARSLEFLLPSPKISREITTLYIERWLKWGLMEQGKLKKNDATKIRFEEPEKILTNLLSAANENRRTILTTLEKHLIDKIEMSTDEETRLALEISFGIQMAQSQAQFRLKGAGRIQTDIEKSCLDIISHIFTAHSQRVQKLSKEFKCICIESVWKGFISYTDLLNWHGIMSLFQDCSLIMFPSTYLIAPARSIINFVEELDTRHKKEQTYLNNVAQGLEEIGNFLTNARPPWMDHLEKLSGYPFFHPLSKVVKKHILPEDITSHPNALFGFFSLLAPFLEANSNRDKILDGISETDSSIFDFLRCSFLARFRIVEPKIIQDELIKCNFSEEQKAIILSWIRHEIDLIKP